MSNEPTADVYLAYGITIPSKQRIYETYFTKIKKNLEKKEFGFILYQVRMAKVSHPRVLTHTLFQMRAVNCREETSFLRSWELFFILFIISSR